MRIGNGYLLSNKSAIKSRILESSKKDYACIEKKNKMMQEVLDQDLSLKVKNTFKQLDIVKIKDSENINNYFQLGIFKVNLFISKNSVFLNKKYEAMYSFKENEEEVEFNILEEFDMINNSNTYLLNEDLETKNNIKLVDYKNNLEDSHTVILLKNINTNELLISNLTSTSSVSKLILDKMRDNNILLKYGTMSVEKGLLPLRYINKNELKDLEENYNEYMIDSKVLQIDNFMEKNNINLEEDLLNFIKENGNILVDYYGKSILKSIDYSELNKLDNLKVEEIIDENLE